MLQRLIAAALGVLGLLAIGLGAASATVWRPDGVLVATVSADGATRLVAADPGVLELAGDPVTVTVTAAGQTPVVVAVGRDTDVAGWVGADPHLQITGLAGWHALRATSIEAPAASASTTGPGAGAAATESAAAATGADPAASAPAADPAATGAVVGPGATPAASDQAVVEPGATPAASDPAAAEPTARVADPTGSDMWVSSATGNGSATLTWSPRPGRWSLVVASLGDAPPIVTMSWPRVVATPWLRPGIVVGALLLCVSVALAARLWLRARRGIVGPEWHPVTSGATPVVRAGGSGGVHGDAGAPLTRRQLREAQALGVSRPAGRRDREGLPAEAPAMQPDSTAAMIAAQAHLEPGHARPDAYPSAEAADARGAGPSEARGGLGFRPRRRDAVAEPAHATAADRSEPARLRDVEAPGRGLSADVAQPRMAPAGPGQPMAAPRGPATWTPGSPVMRTPVPGVPSRPEVAAGSVPAEAVDSLHRRELRGRPRPTGALPPPVAGPQPVGSSRVPGRLGPVSSPDATPMHPAGARWRPTSASNGPDAATPPAAGAAGRPAWMAGWSASVAARRGAPDASQPPAVVDEPVPQPPAEMPAARADAWRRAWGFPQEVADGDRRTEGSGRPDDEGVRR